MSACHHVSRATPTGHSHDKIGLPLVKHLLIADRAGGLAVFLPVRREADFAYIAETRPLGSQSVSATRATVDNCRNRTKHILDGPQAFMQRGAVVKVPPTADKNLHASLLSTSPFIRFRNRLSKPRDRMRPSGKGWLHFRATRADFVMP